MDQQTLIHIFLILIASGFIGWIFYISNREIRASRRMVKETERSILEERDTLERILAQRTEEYIRANQARLQELHANAQFGELSKGLFHDLMNPLTSISMYLENIQSQKTISPDIEQMLQKTIGASRRMKDYMDSIKRTIHSGTDLTHMHTDIGAEIILVRDLLAFKARSARVALMLELTQDIFVSVEPIRIHQVILNLTTNAIEACAYFHQSDDAPGHQVHISLSRSDALVHLSVRDTGGGFSPENEKRIFKQAFTTKTHGTGIGLMTVKNIVERELGGTLLLKNTVGLGSEFVVNIPLRTV
jgi:signal transduction histidine kinase